MSGVVVVKQKDARVSDLKSKRGTMARLIDETTGAKNVDFHINTINPGPGEGLLHYHKVRENVYFVLHGKIFIKTPEGKFLLEKGDVGFVPPGLKHAVFNPGDEVARVIEIYAPCIEGDFIEADD